MATTRFKVDNFEERTNKKILEFVKRPLKYPELSIYRTEFLKLEQEEQLETIKAIRGLYFEYIVKAMARKENPIVMEHLGKFVISPGRLDFLNIIARDDFDGDYKAAGEETKKLIKERVERKYKERQIKRETGASVVISKITWNGQTRQTLL